ncbi:uncharacterized protein EAF02_004233 [Botrytis sinoallii]|uniref:uncharacterized protein n=1 Tax=Botrytis sinoallii TaxID=1463999 RepID=UPI001901737F|nr:uncharacterized protein EAF02_004233 [Botrytis sinoallii]KAF7885724.1 hypothetical protein EAF02_004233 [Botrytis sinoallii]
MSNLEQKYALLEDDTGSEHESQNFDHSSPKTTRKSRSTILLAGSGLKRDIPVPWPVYSPFDNRSDPKATDKEWEKIGKIRLGVIALPDSCVAEKGLRKAQRFPWDNSKGVYLINANHNLSCLLKLRISLLEFHRGEERSGIFAHVTHCLDALRQGIKFNADDTPDGLAMDIVSPADPV